MTRRPLLAVLAVLIVAATASASNRYDPRLRFRTIATPRFDIYFHQGEERLARRLAAIAEEVAAKLDARLGRPSGRTRVVLVDQTDLSNGWATPVPYNLIEITAVPPVPDSIIGNTDDWLRLVFTHEYTHVVHLDRSRGLFGGLRSLFGRHALVYPNLYLPTWQIEGLATYEETALTGTGRVAAGDFRMMLDRAAAAGRFADLDRASGSSPDWPGGNAAYLYGAYFHQYLSERYGPETLTRLKEETAGRLPYFGTGAYRKVFNRSLGRLWDDFRADARSRAPHSDGPRSSAEHRVLSGEGQIPDAARRTASAEGRARLTRHGFTVTAPRYTPAGRLFYSVVNPHRFPSLLEWRGEAPPRQVANRYLGDALAHAGEWLVFDQLEVAANVALQSDLYAVRADGGGVRRLTRNARAADPDVAPDGRTIVCTVQRSGRRGLALLPFNPDAGSSVPTDLVSDDGTDYSSPRWSPDGRSIVAERRRVGGPSEIVIVERDQRRVRVVAATARGRHANPVWLPGGESLLYASQIDDAPFALHRIDLSSGRVQRLITAGAGAQSPALSPDGGTLVFVGYSADGYDLYSIVFDRAEWADGDVPEGAGVRGNRAPVAVESAAPVSTPYRPWRTLVPTFWTPVIASDDGELVFGGGTGTIDALGRHAYGVAVAWAGSRARPDWNAAYAYDRWWPTLFAAASEDTDPFRAGELRTRELEAGALFPIRRVRWTQSIFASWFAATDTLACAACDPPLRGSGRRSAVRAGWRLDAARGFGYSISDEEGASIAVASEFSREALGSDGNAGSVTLDARGFVRAFPRHGVLAVRLAGASAWGDEAVRRTFGAGGSGPQPGGFAFGLDAVGLMRGFDETDLLGRRVAVANVDYRVPLWYVQRGAGSWPIFLRTIHGSAFADLGHAWDVRFRTADLRRAFGAEVSFDTVVGYALPLTFSGGVSWRRDPRAALHDVAWFARIGRAF